MIELLVRGADIYLGQGTGASLLHHAMQRLASSGAAAITLTVTEGNRQAVALYQAAGFAIRHRFDAMVLERESQWYGE